MKLLVQANQAETPVPSWINGPEVGHVFPYFTRAGIPVGFEEGFFSNEQGVQQPSHGMVVAHLRTNELYAINVEGDAVPLGMFVPGSYRDGVRLGTELETA